MKTIDTWEDLTASLSDVFTLRLLVGVMLSMVLGGLWYGPLFMKQWLKAHGIDMDANKKKMDEMNKDFGNSMKVEVIGCFLRVTGVRLLTLWLGCTTLMDGFMLAIVLFALVSGPQCASATVWDPNAHDRITKFLVIGGNILVTLTLQCVICSCNPQSLSRWKW